MSHIGKIISNWMFQSDSSVQFVSEVDKGLQSLSEKHESLCKSVDELSTKSRPCTLGMLTFGLNSRIKLFPCLHRVIIQHPCQLQQILLRRSLRGNVEKRI